MLPLCMDAQTAKKDTTVAYEKKLSDVEVVSHYTKRRDNGDIVMRMAGNPVAEGKSVLQMLNFIPGVVSKDDVIRINGLENTEIYIGERRSNIEEIKSLQPSQIQQVEVIPYPGAKYGNVSGGIVKIVLRKMRGLSGNVNLSNQDDKEGFVEASLSNFTLFQTGKNTFYNNVSLSPYDIYHMKQARTDTDADGTKSETTMNYKNYDDAFRYNAGFTHDFNSNSHIVVYGGLKYGSPNITNENETMGNPLSINNKNYNFSYNFGSIYKFSFKNNDKWRTLMLKASYAHTDVNRSERYSYAPDKNAKNKRYYYSVTFDPSFSLDVTKKSSLSFGTYMYHMGDNNHRKGLDSGPLSQVVTRRYAINGFDFHPWTEYQASVGRFFFRLSLKYVNRKVHYKDKLDPTNDYDSKNGDGLIPMGMVNWRISDKQSLRLSYRHYYSYPNYGYYNPVATYSSVNFYSIGNQHLNKEKFDRFELSYNINRHISIYSQCRLANDVIKVRTHRVADSDTYYTMPENAGKYTFAQVTTYVNYDIAKIWHTNNMLHLTAYHESFSGKTSDCYRVYFHTSNQVDIGKKCGVGFDWEMYTKSKSVERSDNGGYCLDLSGYYKFTKDLHLNVMLGNIIRTHSKLTIKGDDYEIVRRDMSNLCRLQVNLTWNFSVGKTRKVDIQEEEQMKLQDATL